MEIQGYNRSQNLLGGRYTCSMWMGKKIVLLLNHLVRRMRTEADSYNLAEAPFIHETLG